MEEATRARGRISGPFPERQRRRQALCMQQATHALMHACTISLRVRAQSSGHGMAAHAPRGNDTSYAAIAMHMIQWPLRVYGTPCLPRHGCYKITRGSRGQPSGDRPEVFPSWSPLFYPSLAERDVCARDIYLRHVAMSG